MNLPRSRVALVIRTDFSDQRTWEAIAAAIIQPTEEDFRAHVEFVDDNAYRGLAVEQWLDLVPDGDTRPFFMVVDDVTIRESDNPILVVGLRRDRGHLFRAIPSAVQSIENNLSISNMDFAEFANAVDHNGVFRGF
ncbi:DUF6924 domain-containing protein [Kibdelosporangium lantanae]|uniref:DUF6924 domain-containing protein n=1 Tax=Kibdelosporangium lantanae TaxID=1497396 RepID=A0ABW3M5K3_9PSEU